MSAASRVGTAAQIIRHDGTGRLITETTVSFLRTEPEGAQRKQTSEAPPLVCGRRGLSCGSARCRGPDAVSRRILDRQSLNRRVALEQRTHLGSDLWKD